MRKILLLTLLFTINLSIKAQESETVPFATVERVPVYPGCEHLKENADLKKCMSNEIASFISKNINTRVLSSKLSDGKKRVFVSFKIDISGKVTKIQVRGPSRFSEKEAKRVIRLLPKMVAPGMVDGKPVIVPFSLPIIFTVKTEKPKN